MHTVKKQQSFQTILHMSEHSVCACMDEYCSEVKILSDI
jgi:hypothetical protein